MADKIPVLKERKNFVATRNACKVCSPLGGSIAYKGIKGCVPVIHGGQGCATYIRRYLISHYKEPVDIASSNFSEESTIFGGEANLSTAIQNVIAQYKPEVVGVCTTCLSETIGDDIGQALKNYRAAHKNEPEVPEFVYSSTPSYQGSHMDGFHETVAAITKTFASKVDKNNKVNIFPGFISTEDLRILKAILEDFGIDYIMVPDYSETLDNPVWDTYHRIPDGGTPVDELKKMGGAKASIEFGPILNKGNLVGRIKSKNMAYTGAEYLEKEFGVKKHTINLPVGITQSDQLFQILSDISQQEVPTQYTMERGRLIDAYADGHKYVFGKKAVVYGEEDLVIALTGFLDEIGVEVILAASGGNSGALKEQIEICAPTHGKTIRVMGDLDYEKINELCIDMKPDFLIGNSKGYYIARELKIPIIRVGFPIHDRMGGSRLKHVAYKGAQELFDKIGNAMMEYKQENSEVGYKYI
ncbi:nitrogenase component 1 [Saccharicrinis fermentans]|uniref:nitrogenase component 1 n=1 Tax=Saccharicrinis fermentans TaxID=982 RepID=UPI0004BBAEB0|nr:nitrogenase component 1 [Saccharicrinis fermentans]